MSARRQGACQMPGPRAAHCTDSPTHQWSCYDAGEDVSWNEGQWYDFDLAPHACDDPGCRDQGYRGPVGRESEYVLPPVTTKDDAWRHAPTCPSQSGGRWAAPCLPECGYSPGTCPTCAAPLAVAGHQNCNAEHTFTPERTSTTAQHAPEAQQRASEDLGGSE